MQGECKKANLLVFLPSRSHFYAKSVEMEVVFNRCWVFRDAKCGICKPKLGIYKPYCAVRRIGCNFVCSPFCTTSTDGYALNLIGHRFVSVSTMETNVSVLMREQPLFPTWFILSVLLTFDSLCYHIVPASLQYKV